MLSTGRAWPYCIVGLNQNGETRQIPQGVLWQNYKRNKKNVLGGNIFFCYKWFETLLGFFGQLNT